MISLTEEKKYIRSKMKKFAPVLIQSSCFTDDHLTLSIIFKRLGSLLSFSTEDIPEPLRNAKRADSMKMITYSSTEIHSFYDELFCKIDEQPSVYDKGIDILAEIFHMTSVQRAGLEYLVWRCLDTEITPLLSIVSKEGLDDFYFNFLNVEFTQELRTTYYRDYWSYFVTLNFLVGTDDYKVTNLFKRIVGLLKLADIDSIIQLLLDKEQTTTFQLSDFSWVKKDIAILKKLLTKVTEQKIRGVNILLYGVPGTGKTEFAKALAKSCAVPCYAVKTEDLQGACVTQEDKMNDLYIKQALLSSREKACILFDEAEDVMSKDYLSKDGIGKNYLNRVLENAAVPVIWTTNSVDVDPAFLRRMTYCVAFKPLTKRQCKNVWKTVLAKHDFNLEDDKLTRLVKTYSVPVSIISNAVKCTKLINGREEQLKCFIERVSDVALPYGYKSETKKKKASVSMYSDEYINTDIDLVLLTKRLVNAKKLNFSMCLYGEPGTGKSYYAKHLAKLLKLKAVYKKASDLISPYVGETEQNIAKAFAEAKSKKAMLIFDEADTFLQDRNNAVRSWEVAQVNEMLTQMEAAEYPFICTTNLLDTLDEASLRRFTFKVAFRFMDESQTYAVLTKMFKIKEPEHIRGLTIGDCVTVKKKAKFLNITKPDELLGMLKEEVKLKKSANLNRIGF